MVKRNMIASVTLWSISLRIRTFGLFLCFLDSFAANYSCFTSENTVALCMLYILLFALVCKLVYALALSAVRGGKMVKPPTTPRASPTTSPSVSRSADPSSPAHQGPRRVQPFATR